MGRTTMNSAWAVRQQGEHLRIKVRYEGEGLEQIVDMINFSPRVKTKHGGSDKGKECLTYASKGIRVKKPKIRQCVTKAAAVKCTDGVLLNFPELIGVKPKSSYVSSCEKSDGRPQPKIGDGVRMERMEVSSVEKKSTECSLKNNAVKKDSGGSLILKPKTIKQVLHNNVIYNNYNKGHEDDLFGESKGQAGYGPMKGGKQWKRSLLAKEDSSEDESRSKSDSDEIRDRSPSGWSLACIPLSPTRDTGATPERCKWRNTSPVVMKSERQKASYQLRRLKERSKTEMSSRRVSWVEQSRGRRTSPWCGGLFHPSGLPKEYGQKQARYQSKEIFQDMLVNIRGAEVERGRTPDTDCEEYFSDI